jgi:glutathione S-transferase
MYKLYHYPLCPFSRQARLILAEKGIPFEAIIENPWERRPAYMRISITGDVPLLQDPKGNNIIGFPAVLAYLDAKYREKTVVDGTPLEIAEHIRLYEWFNKKMHGEVVKYVLEEKIYKFINASGSIDSKLLGIASRNLSNHFEYMNYLLSKHRFLVSDSIGLADLSAASQLSVLDYLGEVSWQYVPKIKDWYAVVKSRPSFRTLLADRVIGFTPPKYYGNCDF